MVNKINPQDKTISYGVGGIREERKVGLKDGLLNLRKNSFWILFKTFIQSNRKRFILTILSTSLIFTLLTSFSIVWYNNREQAFHDFFKAKDWYDDSAISTYRIISTANEPNYSLNDITTLIQTMKNSLNDIASNLMRDNYSWVYAFQVYENRYDPQLGNAYGYFTFPEELFTILESNLLSGRMPTNASEVLYFFEDPSSTPLFELNDTLTLNVAGTMYPISKQQVTVVGIISDLKLLFYRAGFSADLPTWEDFTDTNEFDAFEIKVKFITMPEYFFTFINNFPFVSSKKGIAVDINYNDAVLNPKDLNHYLEAFSSFHGSWNGFSPFLDLTSNLNSYQEFWLHETNSIFLVSLPLILLLLFLIIETTKIDKKLFEQSLFLLKNQGLEDKRIRKVILLEKGLYISMSLLIGVFLGLLLSILIFLFTYQSLKETAFFPGLGESLFIIPAVIFLLAFLISGYLFDNELLKALNRSRAEIFRKQRTRKIKKIFSAIEMIMLLPSALCIAFGFLGLFLSYVGEWSPMKSYHATIFFTSLIYCGILIASIILYLLISKLVVKCLCFFGKKIWFKKKNLFTFSLKNFSADHISYRTILLGLMVLPIACSPGLLLVNSYPEHFNYEIALRSGFSDLVVTNWDFNQTTKQRLMAIKGVDSSAEVQRSFFEIFINPPLQTSIQTTILAIKNTTEFAQYVAHNSFFSKTGCSLEDIVALESDDTYLMDYRHAKGFDYSKDEILYNDDFTEIYSNRFPLQYINSFRSFPLLSMPTKAKLFQSRVVEFNLVTSLHTLSHIKSAAKTMPVKEEAFLLLKVTEGANLTMIKEQIVQEAKLTVHEKRFFIDQIDYPFIYWKQDFAYLNIFLSLTILCLVSYLLARNIYLQRRGIVEASVRVGATKNQLLGSFLIEFLVVAFLPVLISLSISLCLLAILMPVLFNFPNPFADFSWKGNWFYVFLVFLFELPMLAVYYVGLALQIRNYHPIKEE